MRALYTLHTVHTTGLTVFTVRTTTNEIGNKYPYSGISFYMFCKSYFGWYGAYSYDLTFVVNTRLFTGPQGKSPVSFIREHQMINKRR